MRPYIIINAAMSLDGKLATRHRKQTAISGKEDFARVDALRAECDAVMVGIGTVFSDNPSLRLKNDDLERARVLQGKDPHPMRVVIDSKARMPLDSDMFVKGKGKVVVIVSHDAPSENIARLEKRAVVLQAGKGTVDLKEAMEKLSGIGVKKLMVEGGATLLWTLMSEGLFDEIRIYIGALIIGGKDAPTFADGAGFTNPDEFTRLELKSAERIDDGILLTWGKKEK